jgi:hypothetical protein
MNIDKIIAELEVEAEEVAKSANDPKNIVHIKLIL